MSQYGEICQLEQACSTSNRR